MNIRLHIDSYEETTTITSNEWLRSCIYMYFIFTMLILFKSEPSEFCGHADSVQLLVDNWLIGVCALWLNHFLFWLLPRCTNNQVTNIFIKNSRTFKKSKTQDMCYIAFSHRFSVLTHKHHIWLLLLPCPAAVFLCTSRDLAYMPTTVLESNNNGWALYTLIGLYTAHTHPQRSLPAL